MKLKIDFMAKSRPAVLLSAALVLFSVFTVAWQGLNFGLDFTGGTLIEVQFKEPVTADNVRAFLVANGVDHGSVQNLGSERDILIRVPTLPDKNEYALGDSIGVSLKQHYTGADVRRAEFVGPVVGDDLRDQGGLAMLAALAGISVYIMFRFTGKFAAAAVIALVHDVAITVGAFSLFRWSVDLSTVAALMTVIGYSLNDTIVICDRIRENVRKSRKSGLIDVINASLNQTMERTLIMSGTTLIVLVGMLVFGGEQLRGFSTALIIGVVVGTYSSIYIAANWLVFAKLSREDLFVPEPENATPDDRPSL